MKIRTGYGLVLTSWNGDFYWTLLRTHWRTLCMWAIHTKECYSVQWVWWRRSPASWPSCDFALKPPPNFEWTSLQAIKTTLKFRCNGWQTHFREEISPHFANLNYIAQGEAISALYKFFWQSFNWYQHHTYQCFFYYFMMLLKWQ